MTDLCPKEVATIMGVHTATIYRLIKRGELKAYAVADQHTYRITPESVEEYRKNHQVNNDEI